MALGAMAELLGWLGRTKVRGAITFCVKYWPIQPRFDIFYCLFEVIRQMGTKKEGQKRSDLHQGRNPCFVFSVANVDF